MTDLDLTEAVARALFDAAWSNVSQQERDDAWTTQMGEEQRSDYAAQAEAAIAVVRERIAADIEAARTEHRPSLLGPGFESGLQRAARIARGGGP